MERSKIGITQMNFINQRRSTMKAFFVAVVLVVLSSVSFAHSGGTDKNGCHHETKTGGYHCH